MLFKTRFQKINFLEKTFLEKTGRAPALDRSDQEKRSVLADRLTYYDFYNIISINAVINDYYTTGKR